MAEFLPLNMAISTVSDNRGLVQAPVILNSEKIEMDQVESEKLAVVEAGHELL
jgi:hypothetical protein